jgi:hypothetical protein
MGKPMSNDQDTHSVMAGRLRRVIRYLGRPRIVMGLLLIIAIPIFMSLANKAVRENAEAIRQGFGQ